MVSFFSSQWQVQQLPLSKRRQLQDLKWRKSHLVRICCFSLAMFCSSSWTLMLLTLMTFLITLLSSLLVGIPKRYPKLHLWRRRINNTIVFALCLLHLRYHWWTCSTWVQWLLAYFWDLMMWIPRTCSCLLALMIMKSQYFALTLVALFSKLRFSGRPPPSDGTRIRAYHGTQRKHVKNIRENGFQASVAGMLGSGVYVSRDLNKAWRYSQPHQGDGVILELEIEVGKVCIVDKQGHKYQKNWHAFFDTAWVPSNCKMVHSGLEEGCIAEPRRVRLVRVWPTRCILRILSHEAFQLVRDAWKVCLKPARKCADMELGAARLHNRVKVKQDWSLDCCLPMVRGTGSPKGSPKDSGHVQNLKNAHQTRNYIYIYW